MSNQGQAKCTICYPARLDEPPSEMALYPQYCPSRANHETISRAFAVLGQFEAQGKTDAVAQVKREIDRLRASDAK